MNNKENNLQDEPLIISTFLINKIIKIGAGWTDVYALYSFYCYAAKRQKTNQPHSTTTYTAKNLKWTENKVRKNKKILKNLGLIEDIQQRLSTKIIGHYIKIKFIWGCKK